MASVAARARRGANAAAATINRTSRSWPPPPPSRTGARLVISARQFTPSDAPSSSRGPAQPLPATRAGAGGEHDRSRIGTAGAAREEAQIRRLHRRNGLRWGHRGGKSLQVR